MEKQQQKDSYLEGYRLFKTDQATCSSSVTVLNEETDHLDLCSSGDDCLEVAGNTDESPIQDKNDAASATSNEGTVSRIIPVWSRFSTSAMDESATKSLIEIMNKEKIKNKLNERKTRTNVVYGEIYTMLSAKFFIADSPAEGAERIHQKWRNIVRSFINYEKLKKTTGKGKLRKPVCYETLTEILADKHTINPIKLHDSLGDISNKVDNEVQNTTNKENTALSLPTEKLKPTSTKNKVLDYLKDFEQRQEQRSQRLEAILQKNCDEKKRTNTLLERLINTVCEKK